MRRDRFTPTASLLVCSGKDHLAMWIFLVSFVAMIVVSSFCLRSPWLAAFFGSRPSRPFFFSHAALPSVARAGGGGLVLPARRGAAVFFVALFIFL